MESGTFVVSGVASALTPEEMREYLADLYS